MQNTINALAKDFEVYYLTNGQYPGEDGIYGIDITYPGCNNSGSRLICKNFDVDYIYYPGTKDGALFAYSKNKQYGLGQWLQRTSHKNKEKQMCCAIQGTQYEQFCKKSGKTGEAIFNLWAGTGNLSEDTPCYEYN